MNETAIYSHRFTEQELDMQRAFWAPICRFIEPYMSIAGATLDLGAGFCHFINNVKSGNKFALDVNGVNLAKYARPEVKPLVCSGAQIPFSSETLDTVFASNVYEHFHNQDDVASSFKEVWRVLRSGGRFLILQPNFAYCFKEYFDFFDHRLAFTHRAMTEGLEISGFRIIKVIPQFLPFTSKSSLPKAAWLVSLYLRFPLAWRLLGGQMFIVAEKTQ
jgi:SAM-dependent methyltransferase